MITLYGLYNLTGYHPHSRTKWTKKHFNITTKESKQVAYEDYLEVKELLIRVSKKPDLENLRILFHIPFENNAYPSPSMVKGLEFEKNIIKFPEHKPESHSEQMIDIMNKDRKEEFKTIIKNCSNCLYNGENNLCDCDLECIDFNRHVPGMKVKNLLPGITKDDYEVLKNSFDDLLEMYQNQERRLLILEKRLELPKRAFRNEIINAINTICHKEHREQHTIYKEVYQGFDIRYGLKDKTKNIKTTYLEWYDQNDYLPRLLNYIKEVYKV